jgi:hypothetical protein
MRPMTTAQARDADGTVTLRMIEFELEVECGRGVTVRCQTGATLRLGRGTLIPARGQVPVPGQVRLAGDGLKAPGHWY